MKLKVPQTSTKEDSSAAAWLHNKLASSTHLWSFSSTVATQYTYEKLQSIKECFSALEPLVKIKFFLTLLYVPKRNLEEFRLIVQEIIDSTIDNSLDQWVLSIAQFIQSFWEAQCLDTESDYDNLESFKESYLELTKTFEKCMNSEDGNERAKYLMPIECEYLSKEARLSILSNLNFLIEEEYQSSPKESQVHNLTTLIGSIDAIVQEPKKHKPVQHFSLIKSNKLNSQIEDLKERANKYQKIKPTKTVGFVDGTESSTASNKLSFMHRGTTSKKLDSMSMDALNSAQPLGSSSFFKRSLTISASTITGKSSIVKRDIGIKLLDSDEQIIFNPREAKRKRKEQEKEALKKVKQEEKESKIKPKEQLKPETKTDDSKKMTNQNDMENARTDSEPPLPTFSTQSAQLPTPQMATFNDLFNYSAANNSNFQNTVPIPFPYQTQNINFTPSKMIDPNLVVPQQNLAPLQPHPPPPVPKPVQPSQEQPENKKQSSLTLTHKKNNPRPDQGPVLLISLNEIEETVTTVTGEHHQVISETYFQMNYETGEYKKVKKIKPLG
ncbi:negative elongation factor A [Brachionus plicatilis]|uniref:Negative elongation factor A n=1 Tax=Brachionus plicatilis TaxID=10195 RepID=A0A3M7RBD6_BRAPC|nr:negative elongation factor A [Brachionus plicatilis]